MNFKQSSQLTPKLGNKNFSKPYGSVASPDKYSVIAYTKNGRTQLYLGLSKFDANKAFSTNYPVSDHTYIRVYRNDKLLNVRELYPSTNLGSQNQQLGTSLVEDQSFWETHKNKFYIGGGALMLAGVGFYGWKSLKHS